MYQIYADGAVSNNGKENAIGGYGFVILENGNLLVEESKGYLNVTNQKMELAAVLAGIQSLEILFTKGKPMEKVTVFSDSAYLINCYTNKWYDNWMKNGWKNAKKEPVANKDYWELLIPFFKSSLYSFEKVKGHNDNFWNEYVDKMAVKARENLV